MGQPFVTDMSFDELTKLVKTENDAALLNALDLLLSAVLVLLPAATGTPATWALIEPKNELVKLGRQLIAKLARKRKDDFLARQRRIAAAHALVCYTAFFDAANKVTTPVAKQLDLSPHSKASLVKDGLVF